jgi:hypothetical protein
MPGVLLIDQPLQTFLTQLANIATGWANPITGAGITSPAPAFNSGLSDPSPQWSNWAGTADGLPDGARNDFNCHLDWSYDCPIASPDGTTWVDSGGKTLLLPTPLTTETYDMYVARLQSAGFVGSISRVDLDSDSGDSDFAETGIPCTAPSEGSRIRIASTVTLYVNPAVFGANEFNTTPMCGGRLATTRLSNNCAFTPSGYIWSRVADGTDATFYTEACSDAWAYFWGNQEVFGITDDAMGYLKDGVDNTNLIRDIRRGDLLGDEDVRQFLGSIDPDLSHWQKATTLSFSGAPHSFQVHLYYNTVTRQVRFDLDFKLKFNSVFTP